MSSDYIESFDNGPFVFRLNENCNGPTLLIQVCLERGWRSYQPEMSENWNLWWRSGISTINRRSLHPWQFSNHIPKGASICKKDNLARHLKCMKKVYGSIYDFSPPGYNLPLEYAKLAAECSRIRNSKDDEIDDISNHRFRSQKIWICKPVGQSQGRGIYLFRHLSDLACDSNTVVQKYIERPLLIGGYKFDLRLYVCIPSYQPLTVYLYKEGLARFSTDKFSLTDLQNPFRHLTNTSLNKFGPKYAECKDRIGSGCKWTLRQVRQHLSTACARAREWRAWQRIAALVALTALAQAAGVPPAPNCFEFFGFDVLLDADLKPWLLEVNFSPALANDCDADEIVKKPLLHDLFDLLGLPMCNTGLSVFTVAEKNESRDHKFSRNNSYEDDSIKQNPMGSNKAVEQWRNVLCENIGPVAASKIKRRRPASGKSSYLPPRSSLINKKIHPISAIILSFPSKSGIEESSFEEETYGKNNTTQKTTDNRRHKYIDKTPPVWGNGRDWSTAPKMIGGWIKLFPLDILSNEKNRDWQTDNDIRKAVNNIARFSKAARTVEHQFPYSDDKELNEQLCKELESNVQIWLPEK